MAKLEIGKAWELVMSGKAEVGGRERDYSSSIDPDQAINDEGEAVFSAYYIAVEDSIYEYSATEMEQFASTW